MRPALHFTAQEGWINDPHGITYRDGRYHAFYQYVPGQTHWDPGCHWGHAVAPDLLSLRELPVAIAPGEGDDGIWTGALVVDDDDRARIFYTSTTTPDFAIGRVRVATPADDGWLSWTKGDFVVDAPEGLDLIAYRDPFVRKEGGGWRMFVGAGLRNGTAAAVSYTSDNLEEWSYDGIALQRSSSETDPVWMGALWECPQIFAIGERGVMVSSVWDADVLHYAGYALGDYAAGRFSADNWGRLTFGDSYYAPSLFMDAAGEPCLSLWMRGIEDLQAGWVGAHSIPYRLRVEGERLIAQPHPDVANHRTEEAANGVVAGLAADIEWSAGDGVLAIRSGGRDAVNLRRAGGTLTVSTDAGSVESPVDGDLRIIIDGPVLEISSAAGLYGCAIRPAGEDLAVTATGGAARTFRLA